MQLREYQRIKEQVWFDTLPNGLSIYVVPKKGFFKSTAVFATKYGGSDRRFKLGGKWHDTPAGVAHFLEHKMFDKKDLNVMQQFSSYGASPNAFTSSGMTAYHFECTENFEENLKILLKFVTEPYFTEESVAKEQGIIAQEIRMIEDNPQFVVYRNLMQALYSENPIRDSVAGTVESIAEITAQTLYYCHEAFYHPSNMVLCAAGDVDPERIRDITKEILPEEKKETAERDYGKNESPLPHENRKEVKMEIGIPIFMAGAKLGSRLAGIERQRQELIGDFAMSLFMGKSSPLYARLYSEGLINNTFYGGTSFFPDGAVAVFGGESRDPDAVFSAVTAEAEKFAAESPDRAFFERLKKAALGEEIRGLNSMYGICTRQLPGHFEGFDPFKSIEILDDITIEDAISFIEDNLKPEKLAVSVVRPSK
jgi:predicted Zn-dependent peptidase